MPKKVFSQSVLSVVKKGLITQSVYSVVKINQYFKVSAIIKKCHFFLIKSKILAKYFNIIYPKI